MRLKRHYNWDAPKDDWRLFPAAPVVTPDGPDIPAHIAAAGFFRASPV